MSECIHEKYLYNGEIKSSIDFSDGLINKGLSVYEVIRIIQGKYLFLEDHIFRLKASLRLVKRLYISDIKLTIDYLFKYKLITDIRQCNVKVVINFSNGLDELPDVFVYQIGHYYPTYDEYHNGVSLSLISGERNMPNAKFINLKINRLVDKGFYHKNVFETLLMDEHGYITEGSKSNVFFINNNAVYTAPDKAVLLGITRKHVIQMCTELKIPIRKINVHVDSIEKYDAAFISGTSVKLLPVKQIDKNHFDVKNKTMLRLIKYFDLRINDYLAVKKEINNGSY